MATRKKSKVFDGSLHNALSGNLDRFKGITIADDQINASMKVEDFRTLLTNTISVYRAQGFRGVWLKLKKEQAHLAGVAVQDAGFSFHHAKDDYLMLNKWLPDTPNKMPTYATHFVGVGGLVLNKDRTKLLAI